MSARHSDMSFERIDVCRQDAAAVIFLTEKLNVRFSAEHYYNTALSGSGKSMWFADAVVSLKSKRVEYLMEVRNLFGTNHYRSASSGEAADYFYSYHLRKPSAMLKLRFSLK